MKARRTRPWRTSSPSTKLAVLAATAKQMPCAPMITAVFTPTTSPCDDTSGPPELPGLSAASVWITSSISRPVRERKRAAERRDDAGGHRRFEAERIADGDHQLAALKLLGIAERRGRQGHRLVDADQRQIGVGIVADEPRGEVLAVRRRHLDARGGWRCCRAGDVAVGQDQPVGRDDDAGAGAAARGRPLASPASDRRAGPRPGRRGRPRR